MAAASAAWTGLPWQQGCLQGSLAVCVLQRQACYAAIPVCVQEVTTPAGQWLYADADLLRENKLTGRCGGLSLGVTRYEDVQLSADPLKGLPAQPALTTEAPVPTD